mgnify:CR=1 FL=1
MDVYAVIGEDRNIQSSVMRALTGCWQGKKSRLIEQKNGKMLKVFIDFTSVDTALVDTALVECFEELIQGKTKEDIDAVFIQAQSSNLPFAMKFFEGQGWNLKRLFVLADASDISNFESFKTYPQYQKEPINVVAAAAREFFEWV